MMHYFFYFFKKGKHLLWHIIYHFHLLLKAFSFSLSLEIWNAIFFFIILAFCHFSLPSCFLSFLSPELLSPPSLFLLSIFFIFPVFLHFLTSKAVIFYIKIVIFISDSMTTISYLRSFPSLYFYLTVTNYCSSFATQKLQFFCVFYFFVL